MISISLLDCDLLNIEQVLSDLYEYKIRYIHLDILDTSFVPNISFGPNLINKILSYDFIFDVHIMIAKPIRILKLLNLNRIEIVTIHYEIENFEEVINYLRLHSIKIGLALNPETEIPTKIPVEVFRILFMTVYPGFGHQEFIPEVLQKVKNFNSHNFEVGFDGGINCETIKFVSEYDYFVVGSAFFKSLDKRVFLEKFHQEISKNQ